MDLTNKINTAITLLLKHEKDAIALNKDGYYVAFSGGKDSQVIYELCKMAGVKFKAHFSNTTVDPPQLLKFIKNKYPDVVMHRPQKSMFKLIRDNKSLPMRHIPYCCRLIKEIHGINSLVINGIRKQESFERKKQKNTVTHVCVMGQDKFILALILEWTNNDIWNFIRKYIGYYCELYDMGFSRIGCVFCPNASHNLKYKQLKLFPKFKYAYEKAIQYCIDIGKYIEFEDKEDVFYWWISGKSKKKYLADKKQYKIRL